MQPVLRESYRSLQMRAREQGIRPLTQKASVLRGLMGEPEPVPCKRVRSGAGCSASGGAYEKTINAVVGSLAFQHHPFVMAPSAGSSHGVDICGQCDAMQDNPLCIEAKSTGANSQNPDWGQICVKCLNGRWAVPDTSRSPEACKAVLASAFGERVLWGGEDPLASQRTIEQLEIERASGKWRDIYITDDVDPDSIRKFYRGKGCEYIQIKGKGLYSLGTDSWGLGVPVFDCPCRVRVRVKTHKSCTVQGYASLSVTAALQPVGLKHLNNSPCTLDGAGCVPNVFTPI